MMQVKVIAPFMLRGEPIEPGSPDEPKILDLSVADAQTLIANYKAELFMPVQELNPAWVLAAAKTELLEKIALAQSLEALDELLSEDPDVIAAYERRIEEIDAAEKASFIQKIAAAETVEALQNLLTGVNPDAEIQAAADARLEELTK
jgi:hypothetical protein